MRASHLHEPCAIKFLAWLKRIKRTIWLRFDFHVLIPSPWFQLVLGCDNHIDICNVEVGGAGESRGHADVVVVIMALIVSNVACTSHDMSACIIPCNEITAITGRLVTDML